MDPPFDQNLAILNPLKRTKFLSQANFQTLSPSSIQLEFNLRGFTFSDLRLIKRQPHRWTQFLLASHHLQLFQKKKNLPSLISIFLIFEFSSHTNEPHNNTTTHILNTHKHTEFQRKNNTATTLNRTDLQPHQVHARRVARETRDSRLPQPYFRFTSFWLPREEARGAARRPTIY